MTIYIDPTPPLAEVFCRLRSEAGWGELALDVAQKALAAGMINAAAYDGDKVIGFGRVVGDGIMYFYICDMIVAESHRRQGVATRLMESLMAQIRTMAPQGATIALMAAGGKEPLYRKFGFMDRPTDSYGAGMTLFLEPTQ